ncbi:hypothetical protein NVV94_01630 [Pseudomonas sp. LS1212]|uniref:hypothetical protein n=1 Tax=Pseudomonas sp. LS1212 TaxID=2972478 RepID=UPI00215CD295|nr:hypothetical protein [Pseudomonas sp. LS1212]UVJ44341.1 hypothetical protein NVV94_01630 [Pseudomonas sp. LS1212]
MKNSARGAGRKRGARIIAEIAQGLTNFRTEGLLRTKMIHCKQNAHQIGAIKSLKKPFNTRNA